MDQPQGHGAVAVPVLQLPGQARRPSLLHCLFHTHQPMFTLTSCPCNMNLKKQLQVEQHQACVAGWPLSQLLAWLLLDLGSRSCGLYCWLYSPTHDQHTLISVHVHSPCRYYITRHSLHSLKDVGLLTFRGASPQQSSPNSGAEGPPAPGRCVHIPALPHTSPIMHPCLLAVPTSGAVMDNDGACKDNTSVASLT